MFIPRECWSSHLASSIFVCKVTWCRTVWTSVDTSIGIVDMTIVKGCASTANERCTTLEYIIACSNRFCAPVVFVNINSLQIGATSEQLAHTGYSKGEEATQVKRSQR